MNFSQILLDNFRGRLAVLLLHPHGVYSWGGVVLVSVVLDFNHSYFFLFYFILFFFFLLFTFFYCIYLVLYTCPIVLPLIAGL